MIEVIQVFRRRSYERRVSKSRITRASCSDLYVRFEVLQDDGLGKDFLIRSHPQIGHESLVMGVGLALPKQSSKWPTRIEISQPMEIQDILHDLSIL